MYNNIFRRKGFLGERERQLKHPEIKDDTKKGSLNFGTLYLTSLCWSSYTNGGYTCRSPPTHKRKNKKCAAEKGDNV